MTSNSKKRKRQENSVKNPGAAILIYNYKHRLGVPGLSEKEAHEVDELLLNTVSLKKVTTSKTKSSPAGNFEISLAPTKNWVNVITPGSWCIILMSQDKITAADVQKGKSKASYNKVKMLGRIESVRAISAVDQASGAITTEYVVQGEDWGGILNTFLYVDPLIRSEVDKDNPYGAAARYVYNKKLVSWGQRGIPLPSSTENIRALISFWGATTEFRNNVKQELRNAEGRISESKNQFRFPKELSEYFDFKSEVTLETLTNIADILKVISGKLHDFDKQPRDPFSGAPYRPVDDGAAPIMLDTILGSNSFWQLIINNSNHWINDTYAEMRWDERGGDIVSSLAIYNRIKPFALASVEELTKLAKNEIQPRQNPDTNQSSPGRAIDSSKIQPFEPKQLEDLVSPFKYVRKYEVDRSDLILANVGTNWRDRYNFIEVNINSGQLAGASGNENFDASTKRRNQTFDDVAIGRDGFKPMFVQATYIPKDIRTGIPDPFRILEYKVVNREWFFNTHRMLNGSMTLIGQSDYVAVGDNLIIDADAIFSGRNANKDHVQNKGKAYMLAHIESVKHTCTVNDNGTRSFQTEIQFVRGIITDINGKELGHDQLIDEDASKVVRSEEVNSNRSFGSSAGKGGQADPDVNKLRGE